MNIAVSQNGTEIKIDYRNVIGEVNGLQIAEHVQKNFNWAKKAALRQENGAITMFVDGVPKNELELLQTSVQNFVVRHQKNSDKSDIKYVYRTLYNMCTEHYTVSE